MQMEYIYNFWHLFCQTFDTVSCAVYKVCDVLWSILIVNFNTMNSTLEFMVGLWYNITYVLSICSEVIMCVVPGVIEFVIEVGNCLGSLVTFIWKLIVLIYHAVSVVVTAFEKLISLVWTGSVGTMTMMGTSIEVLKESWACTWNKGEAFITKLFMLIIGGFETIGSVFIELVVAAFNVLVYGFVGIPRGILYICDYCIDFITYSVDRLEGKLYSFSKESFLGLSMCILLLAMFFNSVQIMNFLDSRGMTFPFFRSRERHRPFRSNTEGGYNFEFSDNEPMEDDEEEEEEEGGEDDYGYNADDVEEDRMTHTTNNSNHDSETESLSSSSSSSISSAETSESDIDIQLPSCSHQSNPDSRTPTPMDSEYVEKVLEYERDKRKCVVCQDRMKSVLILPCRHMCLCVSCAEHIVKISASYRRLCPLCRVRIEKVMNVYV